MPPTVEERARHKAQAIVMAIEVDGECEHIAQILARYPGLPPDIVQQITRAAAELIGAVFMLDKAAGR